MRTLFRHFHGNLSPDRIVGRATHSWIILSRVAVLLAGFAAIAAAPVSLAESRTDGSAAAVSLNFRIVVPARIRVAAVKQPDMIFIKETDITQGYIDLDAGTSVKLTVNTRAGYQLAARYDANLLSGAEVRVSNQKLTATLGYGSMRVASGLVNDKVVPIGYRLHLAQGVRVGEYRWPVALAFSLAMV
jgi:hypothetical protein